MQLRCALFKFLKLCWLDLQSDFITYNLSLNKVQEMSLNHLWDSILHFLEFGDEEFSLEGIIDELNSE